MCCIQERSTSIREKGDEQPRRARAIRDAFVARAVRDATMTTARRTEETTSVDVAPCVASVRRESEDGDVDDASESNHHHQQQQQQQRDHHPTTSASTTVCVTTLERAMARRRTSVKPSLPVVVQDVSYEVRDRSRKDARATLLREVSAAFPPGRVSALMGPSGAGKTTLLDVVSGRKTQGFLTGRVVVGTEPASKEALKTCAAYVEQFDCLLPSLTVRETLAYQADLKRNRDDPRSAAERDFIVERLIEDLRLQKCADVVVGNALSRGISGGQAKRVNIGISLVTRPRVLFLDEPTSGLDSKTSFDLMRVIRKFSDTDGVTVIATIHSPSSEAFRQFDRLVMLKAGRVTYAGPLFGEEGAEAYFYSLGHHCDPSENFADFLIATVADDAVDFANEFRASFHHKRNRDEVRKYVKEVVRRQSIGDVRSELLADAPRPQTFWRAVWTLLRYRTTRNYRDAQFVGARCAGQLIFAAVMASMYSDQGKSLTLDAQITVSNMLFMNNVLPAFSAGAYLPSILMERPLLYRELDDGCYPLSAYVAYKVIEEAIVAFFVSLFATTIVYNAVQLQGNFLVDWFAYFGVQQCGAAVAYVCAAVARDVDAANAILPVYNVLQILFAGLLLHPDQVPPAWSWWPPTLFVRYGWRAQMLNHFRRREPAAFLADDGVALLGVTDYYDVRGSVAGNLTLVFVLWVFWLALASLAVASVRHQNR